VGSLKWDGAEASMFCNTVRTADGRRLHLLMERMPSGPWNWTIWDAEDPHRCQSGMAETSEGAAASAAAQTMQ